MLGPCVQETFSLVTIGFLREGDIFDRESFDSNRVGLGYPRLNSLAGTHVSVLLTLVVFSARLRLLVVETLIIRIKDLACVWSGGGDCVGHPCV